MTFKRKNIFESTMTIHEFLIMMDKLKYVECTSKQKKRQNQIKERENERKEIEKKILHFYRLNMYSNTRKLSIKHITQIFPLTKLLLKMPALYINTNI